MVMMELIDGPDARQAFEDDDLQPTVLEDIHNAKETTRCRTRLWRHAASEHDVGEISRGVERGRR